MAAIESGSLLDAKVVKIAVIGSGAFGTAIATVAARNGHLVTMCVCLRYPRCLQTLQCPHLQAHLYPTTNKVRAGPGAG